MATPSTSLFFLILTLALLSLSSISTSTSHHPLHPKHPKHSNSTAAAAATTNTTTTTATNSFIVKSCRATQYPALCYHCLSVFENEIKHSERRLALTALAVSLSRARATSEFVHKLKSAKGVKISHRELEAVKDCIDTMGDTVDQLSRSIKELGHMGGSNDGQDFMWHVSNVQTWVSAALTNENTCVDGLSESHSKGGKIKGAIKMRVNNVAQVTSNALALVNHFATKYGAAFNDPRKH